MDCFVARAPRNDGRIASWPARMPTLLRSSMPRLSRSAFLLTACAAALPLAGCAHGGSGSKADTSYVARDVNTLYATAKLTLNRGDYETAAKLFDEVERQHPYSVW